MGMKRSRARPQQGPCPRVTSRSENSPARRTLTTLRETERELLPCFQLGGDQAHLVDARSAHNVDRPRNLPELTSLSPLTNATFSARSLNTCSNARPEAVPSGIFIIDF